jgi:hypothetical protein
LRLGLDRLLELAGDVALRLKHAIEPRVGAFRLMGGGPAQREGDDDGGYNDANRQYYQGNFHDERCIPLTVKRAATISGA